MQLEFTQQFLEGNIKLTSSNNYGSVKVEVFDITGKLVLENSVIIHNNTNELDLSNLTPGNYFLKMSGDHFQETEKIIIQ
ncbi:T9SS type A sorting domain-containing protein [Flavobacterium covae]|nr:T9SS type A sorting domain-containing protein [Flavobacterium covae]